jgi:hypothetical protein
MLGMVMARPADRVDKLAALQILERSRLVRLGLEPSSPASTNAKVPVLQGNIKAVLFENLSTAQYAPKLSADSYRRDLVDVPGTSTTRSINRICI